MGFVFLSDGDSYIAKKSLSKINPNGSGMWYAPSGSDYMLHEQASRVDNQDES